MNFQAKIENYFECGKSRKAISYETDAINIFYLTFRLFSSLLFLVYIITLTIFCYSCYLLRLSDLLLQTAQHVSFPLSIHTNRYEYKSNRNTFTLTMNKKAVRRVCGLCYGKQSKIAMCQQVYFLLMVINICCNESEIMMADLQLCMSSPGNNFVQLSAGRGEEAAT